LNSESSIKSAFHIASKVGTEVLVERYVLGDEHRLLVVGDRMVAAAKGETASVVGDGVHTVAELIDLQINSDPRRGATEDFVLNSVRLNDHPQAVLQIESQGHQVTDVLPTGKELIVQRNGNMNNDVTEQVHPEVAAMACLAARVIGLDVAGIDLVAQDVSKPLSEQDAAIVEVNAGPGLLMHLKPVVGKPRAVGKSIIDHLFPAKENGRIPIVGILGSEQTCLLSHLVAWLVHLSGKRVGLACEDGLYMDQRKVQTTDARNYHVGERLLINRTLDAGVFQTSPWHILQDGLPYDRCQVGVVTDMPATDDVLVQLHDIQTPDQMRTVIRTQVDLVLPTGAAAAFGRAAIATHCCLWCVVYTGSIVYWFLDPLNLKKTTGGVVKVKDS
jgi:cyanophycin synthetase